MERSVMEPATACVLSACYLVSGFVMAGSYAPQLIRGWRHPDATAVAQSFFSWAVWAGCRAIALLYGVWVIGDPLFIVAVSLDLLGRLAVLLVLVRAMCLQASSWKQQTPRRLRVLKQAVDRAGRAFPFSTASCKVHGTVLLSCLAVLGCTRAPSGSESSPGTSGDVVAAVRAQSFQGRALNVLLLSLLEPEDPPRWQDPTFATECAGQVAVTIDGEPLVAGRLLPATAFELRWSGTWCGVLGDDIAQLSGDVSLLVIHDEDSYSAVVRPAGLLVVTGDGPVLLSHPFTARTPLGPPVTARQLYSRNPLLAENRLR